MTIGVEEPVKGPFHPSLRIVTLTVLTLVTISAFENLAVSTIMPDVARDLQSVRSYGLAFSVMMTTQLLGIVVAGVWTDRSGPIPGTFAGQVLLAGGSLICALATRNDVFLLGRALAGLGVGLLVVMLYVIAGRVYSDAVRPRLFTYLSAAWILPALIGPPVAAALADHLSWRWVFAIVVAPIVGTVATMTYATGHVSRLSLHLATSSRDHSMHVRAAWSGLGIALAAGAVQFGIDTLESGSLTYRLIGIGGVVGVLAAAPLLVPTGTWLMARGLPSVIFSRAALAGAFFGAVSFVPLFLHQQRGASLRMAGLALAVGSLGWALGAFIQGREQFNVNRHRLVEAGGLFLAAGLAVLAVVASMNLRGVISVLALVLCGLGMGLGVTTTSVLALELSPVEEHGESSSALLLSDVLGSVLGIAVASAIFAAHHIPGRDNALFGAIFALLAVIAATAFASGQRIST